MKQKLSLLFISVIVFLFVSGLLAREIHVAKTGNDGNSGSISSPYLTISTAAFVAQPGDVITVHAGIYREWVKPPRSGTSESSRIIYQAAQGEQVSIKGSEQITTWVSQGGGVWKVDLPDSFFGSFNPYALNVNGAWIQYGTWHHRGDVFLNGDGLYEKQTLGEVQASSNTWYTSAGGGVTSIYANFGSANPNTQLAEINVREMIFAPVVTGINYITVSGFTIMQCADNWDGDVFSPNYTGETQKGAIAPYWSRSWIIENCRISYARCAGICIGYVHDHRSELSNIDIRGHHIIRNNIIQKCGQVGICGQWGAVVSEISGNLIEDINYRDEFGGAENAGIKLHYAIDVVIRNNCIRRIYSSQDWNHMGIWLDWGAQGTRITGNVIYDISGDAPLISFEVDHGPILVDNNVFLGGWIGGGCEAGIFIHNIFYNGYAYHQPSYGDMRSTPYFQPHSCIQAGSAIRSDSPRDDHFYNNIFISQGFGNYSDARNYDYYYSSAVNVDINWNAYLQGALKTTNWDSHSVQDSWNTNFSSSKAVDGITISFTLNNSPFNVNCPLITHDMIGLVSLANEGVDNPDGSPLTINTDYFGNVRSSTRPAIGPFENIKQGLNTFRLFPLSVLPPAVPVNILVTANKTILVADGINTSTLTARVCDSTGNTVTTSTATVTFTLSGTGSLIGATTKTASGGIATIVYKSGTSTGTATITATSAGLTQGSVNITLQSIPTNPIISVDQSTLNFGMVTKGTTKNMSFNISNIGAGTLTGTITSAQNWIIVNPTSCVIPAQAGIQTVTVTVDNNILNQGSGQYSGTVSLISNGGNLTVNIIMTATSTVIFPQPIIQVSSAPLNFGEVKAGESNTLTFNITNIGVGTLSGSISSDKDWLQVTPANFNNNNVIINVTVDNSVLNQKEGQYSGQVTVASNGGTAVIDVTLTATCVLVKPNPVCLSENPSISPFIKGRQSGIDVPLITFFGSGIVPGETTIKIYTLSGEFVKVCSAPIKFIGADGKATLKGRTTNEIAWNGLNEQGQPISSGIYIYVYESPREKGIGKFTVITR